MCTLSVVTTEDGYLLGMNRDEKFSRGAAASPESALVGYTRVAFPRDIEGGTWIGVNEHRISFALLNWYAMEQTSHTVGKVQSRGFVIPDLVELGTLRAVEARLRSTELERYSPFRLFGVFPNEREIHEWQWDRDGLFDTKHPWRNGHWFSSGLSQLDAERRRGSVCQVASSAADAGTLAWLRRLHASHANGPGPYSVCVHREDVATLSYTEIDSGRDGPVMRYFAKSPCTANGIPDAVVSIFSN